MTDLPKAGEDWFHQTELFPLRVGHTTEASPKNGHWTYQCQIARPLGPICYLRDDDIIRDYARNEPLTVEFLEGLGWQSGPTSKGCFADKQIGDRRFTALWRADEFDEPDDFTVSQDGGEPQSVPFPATIRDLAHLLKIFGAKESIFPTAKA